jgi:hypothetical protein
MLAIEKHNTVHKNSLAIGTKREVMYYIDSINLVNVLFMLHMST